MQKHLGYGSLPTPIISKKKFSAEAISARAFALVFSITAALISQSSYSQSTASPAVNALPTGGQVVAGQVAISQTSTATSATMNVNQTSQRAVVNWDSFNVGKNAQVNFNQPNQNAVILNRVTGVNSSVIEGAVRANGQVILVNQNGVTFGRGSQVDAAGVVASTLDISNKAFMDGKSTFNGNGKGAILNEGKITTNAEGGYIALLAPEVRNQGYLLAKKGSGTVAITAGEQITLNFQNNSLISVKVDVATYNGLIENKRVVEVNGGLVIMAAGAANQLMASVVKNTGRISASAVVDNGGTIELVANTVTQAGTAAANSKNGQGGQVNIVGNDITIAQNSKTEAKGASGGGQVNMGLASTSVSGGTQVNVQTPSAQTNTQAEAAIKANAQVASNNKQMAKTVTVEQGALIDTSATQSGNGGSIAIWSELKTSIAGILNAMGGALSGNGGFIETSSKTAVALAPTAQINTSANNVSGKVGTWLLDPIDLTIDTAAAKIISAALAFNNVIIEVTSATTACPAMGGCSLSGSGSLTIASGADILKSGSNYTTLTLSAAGIFNLNANISGQNLDVIIKSSIAYLNVGTSITASTVTVQAQTIYAQGNINTSNYNFTGNVSSLGNAIQLLAQAIYVSGGLNLSTSLPVNGATIVTVNGTAKRPEELPIYLTSLNASTSNLDLVYSSTAANDANAVQAAQIAQAHSNVIQLIATNSIALQSTAQVLANGTTGGSIYAQAPTITTQTGSVLQANGNNGPGGVIAFSGDQITVAGNIAANGTTDGGLITLIANNGDLNIQTSIIQTNGGTGRGGSISVSAKNNVTIEASSIEATGANQGGKILIGNDAKNGTLPFSIYTSIDQYSSINAAQLEKSISNQNGGFIETSGHTLNLLSSINAGRGGIWLLDPTDVIINTTAGSSTGTDPLLFSNQTNISASQIQTAINNGISVQIIADGTITQTANLSFSPSSGVSVSLTYDNRTGTAKAITLTGTTTNTGAGDLTLNYLSSGQIKINGAINSTSTGKINVVAQTSYATNTLTTCTAGACASIYNGSSASITTKGGYVVMDATGGTISGSTVTQGTIQNGPIYLNAGINTTTAGGSSNSSGGHFSVAASANLAGGIGSFEPNVATLNIGGDANFQLKNYTSAAYGFVVASYLTTSPITAYGDLNITSVGMSTAGNGLIYLTSALASTNGSINLTATSTNTSLTTNPGVSGTSNGTLTANAGSITINSTSYASTAVSLPGAISAKSIVINGTSTTASTIVSLGAMTIVAGGSDISVTANNTSGGANTGITQTGAITDNASGGNITFTSNNYISQAGAISLAANASGSVATITYDTTAGNKSSTITAGALTITSGSTSDINFVMKSSGSALNPNAIGTSSSRLPGTVTVDNTYGGTTPASGYVTTSNISTLATTSVGVTINNALYATKLVSIKGISYTSQGVNYSAVINASTGGVEITGTTYNNYGIYTSNASLITGNYITINGVGAVAVGGYIAQVGALTINSAATGGDITISATGTSAGNDSGIYQSGAISGASGSDISFTSNNYISQAGAISLAANASGSVATITYDTTAGNKSSTITAGALTITSGSTSDINFVMKSSGSALNPNAIGTSSSRLPGTVTVDNTYGGTTPASGYVTTSNISTLATTSVGVTINNALYATKLVSIKGISYTSQGVNYSAVINASTGGVEITGTTYNNYGIYTSNASLITGDYITIAGRGAVAVGGWIDYIGALTINSGATGGDITITATGTTAGSDNGIYQSGAISGASGSDISFTSNNYISQAGAISLAANASGSVATITYDTTAGNKSSTITAGALTITSGSTSDINFVMKSSGSALNPNAIGTSSSRLPGTVTVDNTYGGTTPASGYVTTSNISTLATTSVGVTINNALYATKLVSIKGISYTSQGVNYSAVINASTGGVEITGTTYNNYGIYTSNASLITGNYITINGVGAVAVGGYIAQVGALTINSAATGGDITISATGTSAGNDSGIYQSGAISGASGSDISFTSNNVINQVGVITMAANATAISAITYDTTSGNRLSTITTGVITATSGSTYAINYLVKSAGSIITVNDVTIPGYINLDNTFGSASGAKSSGYFNGSNNTTSNATGSSGVLVSGVLTAGSALTIKGVSASSWGIQNSSAYTLTAGAGDLTLVGVGVHGMYQMGSLIATSGNISVSAYATSSSWSYYAQSGSQKNYIASGNIDLIGYSTTYSSALNIQNILIRTTTGNITLSARGGANGNGAVHQAIYLAGVVINSGGGFTIQGATNSGGIATAAPGTASLNTLTHYGVHFASTASLAYSGTTYSGYKAAGNISIAGTSTGSYAIYINAALESTAGSVTITGTSTTGYGVTSTSAGTITGNAGVSIYGVGGAGSITTAALVRNTGSTGGVILNAATDASIGAVTNAGADGIRITGGNGVAAGTTTGGTIIALGTVTNTGGVVALSMGSPRSSNSYDVEGVVGITSSNASTSNIRYSIQGGVFTAPTTYSSGNYINYRAATTTYTITVSLAGSYSAAYGVAYTDSSALTWLRSNATVTLSATPFGVSAASIASGLVWNSTIGSAGISANVVQASTTIVSANILAGTGQSVTLSGTSRTYTITTKALIITNLTGTTTYNGTSTYAGLVSTTGYSISGLVTSIGGVAVTDAVNSVTQTIKSGSTVGSGSVVSGVAQNGSFNAVPSAAIGVGLSNYSITYVGVASTVNKATLTITAASDTKVYGNTTTAAGIVYSSGVTSASSGVGYSITSGALLGTDSLTGVTLTSTGGVATTAVGTGISIVPSLATGSGIGNYTITYANAAMSVTARPLTVTASTQNTNYGTSYALGTSTFTTSGLVNTDSVSSAVLKYEDSSTVAGTTNAGTYTGGIVASTASGSGLSNYSISYVAGNLVIATKALTVTASTQNTTYGTAYSLGTSAFSSSGLVNSDAVNSVTLLYSGSASVSPTLSAATYASGITPSAASGTGLSNYSISYVAGNLVVGKATLTLTPTVKTTTYDASTLSNTTYSQNTANYSISGYKNADSASNVAITLTGSMAFSGSATTTVKNAANYALTVGTFAGTTTNGNYQIAFANASSNAYLINPATLTVSAAKDYDGSQSFAANQITVSTGISTQTVTLSGTASANSANVTGVSSLSTAGLSLGDGSNGGLAANYALPTSSSSVVIRPLAITASIVGSPTKVYDTTTAATLTASDYSFSGFIAGQGASASQTIGTYNYANATSNTSYSPATSITASLIPSHFTANVGTDLSNYTLPTTATGSATITPASLTLTANSYAAFAGQSPSFSGIVTGAQGSDSISVSIAQSSSGTSGVYTLTPSPVMSAALVGNYGTPTIVTGTYTEAQQYQLVVSASSSSNAYGVISSSSSANSVVNLVAQYCTVSTNCNSGTIISLTMAAPSANASQITTSSLTTPTWVATDSSANNYSIQVTSSAALGFSTGNFLNAAGYTMTPSGLTNATISGATNPVIYIPGIVTVAPLALTVANNSAPSKVYDATTALTSGVVLTPSNKLTGDSLSLSGSGTYANKNVGTTSYTITSVALSGADAANYRYSAGDIAASNGSISAAPITISGLSVSNKVYDAGLATAISGTPTVQGVLGSDTVTVGGTATSGNFATANVATGIAVTPTLASLSLSNANYQIIGVTTALTADITAAPITATINKVYNGSTLVLNGDIAIAGIAGQTLVLSTGTATLTNPNVGSAALLSLNSASLANGTGLASNYTLTNPSGVVTIAPAVLSISSSDAVKVYDTNTTISTATTAPAATVASGTLYTNSVTGYTDSLSGGSFSYATSAAGSGNKTLNVSSVSILNDTTSAASNYNVTYVANTTSTISQAPITISGLSASNKVYDTGLSATIAGTPTVSGALGSDVVTVNGSATSGSFASANVGTGIVVTPVISGLSLSNANYSITGITSPLSANITAAPITISGLSASNKVYDTGLSATIAGTPTVSGALGSDVVTVNGSATSGSFASANVGTGIVVTPVISGLSLSNANYSITGITSPLSANITAAPLTVTASAQSTIYGTSLALGLTSFTTSGLLGSDTISSVTLTQSSNAVVPGTQNAGTYSGSINGILPSAASGSNLSNYQITYAPGVLTVARKSINVIADNASMTYADSTLPTLTYQSVSGLVNGDQTSGSLATVATPYSGVAGSASNVGSYYITQGTVTAGSNYDISYTRASLTINPANLYVTAQNQSSTYGSLLVLPQSGSAAYSTLGLRNGDYVSSATVLYSGNQTIPGTTNAGSYSTGVEVSAATGSGMGNYTISYVPGDLTISKATLLVTAIDSAKFVGTSDPSGYGGVMYSGFKNSDTASSGALGSAVVTVSRSNSTENNAGTYSDVLVPNVSSLLDNYTVAYANAKFTVVPANQLLVQTGTTSTVYGSSPTYNAGGMTVSYCTDCASGVTSPNIVSISGAGLAVSGSSVTVVNGNTTATFGLGAANPVMNSSGSRLNSGSYSLAASGTNITSSSGTTNFNAVTVVGGLTVTPLALTYADLGISGVSQVYNGSVTMSNISLTANSGFLSGDSVTATAAGTFASKNVGTNITYTVGVALSGLDAANYQINGGSSFTGTDGVITQLNSVTYTGPNSGGNWSNPLNWTATGTTTVGAIPDLSNVANVILPTGYSVTYDDSVQGPVTSAVVNSGNLSFNLSTNTTIPMAMSGTGTVTIAGAGVVTLTGSSSYTGATILNAGTSLVSGGNNAIGAGTITSNGTAANPASFSTGSGVLLPALNIAGGSTEIWSDIATTGTQTYNGSLLIGPSNAGTTSFSSNNANITINGTLDGASNKTESLVINAGTGVVTIGDSVGSSARLNNLTITGSRINVLADILTGATQTYNGAVYIGDASYLGRAPTTGFLFTDNYRGYFQYGAATGVRASTIDYLNTNSIYIRTMISEDPSVTFNGTVNDTVANTHTLLVAAIAPAVIPSASGIAAVNGGASVSFNSTVGGSAPLYSLNAQTVVSNTQAGAATSYIGTVNAFDSVATYSNQTYRANLMSARSSSQPGAVTFSVWDPSASVSFNLPTQTAANSACSSNCGQINFQNPNSLDTLTINGATNFALDANLNGVNNWGNQFVQNEALGYIPVVTTARSSSDSIQFNGGILREALDFHADQVQMKLSPSSLFASVNVTSPGLIDSSDEPIAIENMTGKSGNLKSAGGEASCTVDESGNAKCSSD